MLRPDRLDGDRAFVLVIDIQTSLLPLIFNRDQIVQCTRKLLQAARIFELPVLATEQYPQGIGSTDERVAAELQACDAELLEKLTFSSCGEEPLRAALNRIDRPQVVVVGIEAHVCVQQTVLDLLAMDYDVFVCADAVGSRSPFDYERALSRMQHQGAAVTTAESAMFELCERCGTDSFKTMLKVIKAFPPTPPSY